MEKDSKEKVVRESRNRKQGEKIEKKVMRKIVREHIIRKQ